MLREKFLNLHWFKMIQGSQEKIESWRIDVSPQIIGDPTPQATAENRQHRQTVKEGII
jgi:hypothetical protein